MLIENSIPRNCEILKEIANLLGYSYDKS